MATNAEKNPFNKARGAAPPKTMSKKKRRAKVAWPSSRTGSCEDIDDDIDDNIKQTIRSFLSEELLDRKALATRWLVSIETLKRREKDGTLSPVYLPGGRLVRYRLSDIKSIEDASQN